MTALHRLAALRAPERRMLALALPLVIAVRLLLWILPSPIIVRWVRRVAGGTAGTRMPSAPIVTVIWAIDAVSRRVPGASCLTQAVAAQLLLHRQGYDSKLCLGVAGTNARFTAHAWVERRGRVLIGGEGATGLTRLPDIAHGRRSASLVERS
jgi:hypothetical protein